MMQSTHSSYLSSDLENDRRSQQERENIAQEAIDAVGSMLDTADGVLGDLEKNDMLGAAIVRGTQELADAIEGLANELDQHSDEERRSLARACLQDASYHEQLLLQDESFVGTESEASSLQMTSMSEDDMVVAISGATSLLRDVGAAFRSIDQAEADEIADVALTLARLFLLSLQNLHSTLTPHDFVGTKSRELTVEVLDEDESSVDEEKANLSSVQSKKKKRATDRVRVLWPPLGPAVVSACQWGKDEAEKQPLLAVALGLTLWPVAIGTAFMGAPLVLADGFLQNAYNSLSDGPLVENLERGAAQLYQAGKLSVLCGGLVCRKTLRVASRQIERRGGVGQVAQDVGSMAIDRALHPIETLGMAWDGVTWGVGTIRDAAATVQGMAGQRMESNGAAVNLT